MDAIQYIVDKNGNKTSVVIPFKQWDSLNKRYERLLAKFEVFTGIKNSIKEIRQAEQTGEQLQSLKNFLDECKRQGQ